MLLDLMMPQMDGTETFDALQSIDPAVRVLVSSGYSKDAKVDTLLDRGAVGFIQKPYRLNALSDEIDRGLVALD